MVAVWNKEERELINNLAYFPDPAYVPLLVGMYNGQIKVGEAEWIRGYNNQENQGFDNKTGAYIFKVGEVIEFVIQNRAGFRGLSFIHSFHFHGGDFWDLGSGKGEFDEDVFQAQLATMAPVRRDTTVLGKLLLIRLTTRVRDS